MKNHFVYAYAGNKRNEVEEIYKHMNLDLRSGSSLGDSESKGRDGITTFIECYCGTSALSYYLWKNKLFNGKFILNDIDSKLIKIYKLMKDENGIDKFNDGMKIIIDEFNLYDNDEERKIFYNSLNRDLLECYVFVNKYYCMRAGMYPLLSRTKQIKPFDLRETEIYKFVKDADITFTNREAIDVIEEYKGNKECFLFLDPPYIFTCNDFYKGSVNDIKLNIYEYLFNNNINDFDCEVMLCIENIWINKMLFKQNLIHEPYKKRYENSRKKTEHIVVVKIKKMIF
jgi:site-specific DNA-adenine methylase